MVGGENQQGSLIKVTGYSVTAHCTGKPAYLEPNSNSMQKPIGGLSVLAFSATKSMLKPADGFSSELYIVPLYKGAIVS